MKELAHVSGSNGGFRPEEMHRRQFQRTTFETLNRQAAAIADLDTRVTAAGEFLADQSVRIDDHGKELGAIQDTLRKDYQHFEAVCMPLCNSTLWTRLRWLLTGR
jgi:hypothetical protein